MVTHLEAHRIALHAGLTDSEQLSIAEQVATNRGRIRGLVEAFEVLANNMASVSSQDIL